MIQKGKTFSRRPWHLDDHDLIKHFDGLTIEDAGAKGIYLAMHTSQDFLKQNNIASDVDFSWPGLVVENFSVTNADTGVYITDCPKKANLSLTQGHVVKSKASIVLNCLTLDTLLFDSVTCDKSIVLQNCRVDRIKIVNCSNLIFEDSDSAVLAIEHWQTAKVDDSCFKVVPKEFNVAIHLANVNAAFALNVMIDGNLYGIDIPSTALTPRA